MSCIQVYGQRPLCGNIAVQGSKNAALPILAATILHAGISILNNCPQITDVYCMIHILEHMGCRIWWKKSTLYVDASGIHTFEIPEQYAREMRSSVILLGSMLGRGKNARLTYPGGCVIGKRPIDLHLNALMEMGVEISEEEDILLASADKITGAEITLSFPSVGATENIVLAAVMAEGNTVIKNAAKEPEIEELCGFLNSMGAKISGAGTEKIRIESVDVLHDVEYNIIADRIVAGTYLIAAVVTKGKVGIKFPPLHQLDSLFGLLTQTGARWEAHGDMIVIDGSKANQTISEVFTAPYPGFPTDLQSQLMTMVTILSGKAMIHEAVFEDRFKIINDLKSMGADIKIEEDCAVVQGIQSLTGQKVYAKELRGGAALILAGLCAKGQTTVCGTHFIDRGYEDIVRDLTELGADIKRI